MSKNKLAVYLIIFTLYFFGCIFSCFVGEEKIEVKGHRKTESIEEVKVINHKNEEVLKPKIVYDGLTYDELVDKLEKSLNHRLDGTAKLYVDLSLEYGINPYLAAAISLLETGCKWNCSVGANNVGGNMVCYNGSCSLRRFNTLEAGITYHITNLYKNYYSIGLTEPEQISNRYASSPTWTQKVNRYIEEIKNN